MITTTAVGLIVTAVVIESNLIHIVLFLAFVVVSVLQVDFQVERVAVGTSAFLLLLRVATAAVDVVAADVVVADVVDEAVTDVVIALLAVGVGQLLWNLLLLIVCYLLLVLLLVFAFVFGLAVVVIVFVVVVLAVVSPSVVGVPVAVVVR